MNQPEISIIIPVYKVEKYLNCCLDSVLSQTFSDFEVILVDDGSPDNCGKICDEYAKKDPRFCVIHKENGGISDARNAGLKVATGRYIGFVDSDDYIEPEMYAVLYRMIQEENADIAVCGMYNCFGSKRTVQYSPKETFVCDGKQALAFMLEGKKVEAVVCNKLYRKEFFHKYSFLKDKIYEDIFLLPSLFLSSDKVVVTTEHYYNYRHRAESITTSPYSEAAWDMVDAYKQAYEQIRDYCPELTDIAIFRIYLSHFIVLDRMLLMPDYKSIEKYPVIVDYLRKNWKEIIHCRYFGKKRRFSALVLKCSVAMYRMLLMWNKR